jgi:hypothetical protein
MADVQYWDDTLTEECQSIRQLLNNASSALESAGEEEEYLTWLTI